MFRINVIIVHALSLVLSILLFIVTACGRRTPDPNILIDQAVAATLSAMPQPTLVSVPLPTPFPSPTAVSLNGLFCEYQFCIGHPADMAFYDVSAVTSNQGTPSTYQTGLMAAYSGGLVLQLLWQFPRVRLIQVSCLILLSKADSIRLLAHRK
jgi:hypothetical protein